MILTLGYALLLFYVKQGGPLSSAGMLMILPLWLLSLTFMINADTWMSAVNLLLLLPLSVAAALVLNNSFGDAWKRPSAVLI